MTKQLEQELLATQHQLDLSNAYLALAISQLPKKMLKVTLTEQARLGDQPLELQAKSDDKGTIFIRTVKTLG